jgi:hypothetical protein
LSINYEKLNDENDKNIERILSKVIIPFSKMFNEPRTDDFYHGFEHIPFNNRHPIFKALMKLEFEEVIRAHSIKGS